MENFSTIEVIGKYPEEFGEKELKGSKYDNYDLLLNDYLKLLFYTLTKNGIVYSTERNGILARVKYVDGFFINYVQPSIGKWDFEDSKYQRIVSINFVLYLFNEMCMANTLYHLNYLAEPYDLSDLNFATRDSVDLTDVSAATIMERFNELTHEAYLKSKGLANNLDNYSKKEIEEINLLYDILSRVLLYTSDFKTILDNIKKANELKTKIELEEVDFEDLSEPQQELLETYDDSDFDNYDSYYPCLGYFYHHLKKRVIKELGKEAKQFDETIPLNGTFDGLKLVQKGIYQNPVLVYIDDYEDDDSIKICFDGAKEFAGFDKNLTRERTN